MKMKRELAEHIVQGWKMMDQVKNVPGLCDYLKEQDIYFAFSAGVRVLLGDRAKMASNALWDDKPKTAINCLMKYGFDTKTTEKKKPAAAEHYIRPNKTSGRVSNPRSDWKYVK